MKILSKRARKWKTTGKYILSADRRDLEGRRRHALAKRRRQVKAAAQSEMDGLTIRVSEKHRMRAELNLEQQAIEARLERELVTLADKLMIPARLRDD